MANHETLIPLRKNVIDTFAKEEKLHFVKHESGSIYVCNRQYILKTDQAGLEYLAAQVNRRRRTADIALYENSRILDYVNSVKGTFALTQKPHEMDMGKKLTACIFSDGKQYFGYDKKFVDILRNFDNRLFVDDNRFYDTYNHSLVAKDHNGELLGIALPFNLTDDLYEKLAEILPLEVERKSEIEQIKENPDKDPYIGKEYSDGRDNYIISGIRKHDGEKMYVIPTIENGKVSKHADLIKVSEIEDRIARWEKSRAEKTPGVKAQMAAAAKKAKKHNAARPAPAQEKKAHGAEL